MGRNIQRFGIRDLAAAGLILAVVCIVFAPAIASPNKLLFGKDLDGEWFNYESYIRSALSQGQLPLWNPYNMSGFPVLADVQAGLLYPPNVLLRVLPINMFFAVSFILHFWLAGAGIYLLCRQLALSRAASLAGALGGALSTTLTQSIFQGHVSVIYSLAWMPLAVAFAIRSVQRGSYLPHPGLVFALVMQFMAGFPQTSVYTFGCLAIYYFYSFVWPPETLARQHGHHRLWSQLALVVLLFLGVGAFQILPTFHLVAEAGRTGGVSWDYATKDSLPLAQFGTMWFPEAFEAITDSHVPYMGWFLLMMTPLAFASKERRRFVLFFAGLGFGALLFASAEDFPVFALVYKILPVFRIPHRSLFIWSLCVGVLGAIGFDVLRGHIRSATGGSRKVAYLFGLALLLALFSVFGPRVEAADGGPAGIGWGAVLGTPAWVLVLQAVGFAVLGVCAIKRRRQVLMVIVALGMILIDLYPLTRPLVTTDVPHRYPGVVGALEGLDAGRVIDLCADRIPPNRFMVMRVPITDGYNSLFLADYARFSNLVLGKIAEGPIESWSILNGFGEMPPRRDLLHLINVTHVLSCAPVADDELTLVREFEREAPGRLINSYVYEVQGALPRAFFTCDKGSWATRDQGLEFLGDRSNRSSDLTRRNSFTLLVEPRACRESASEPEVVVLSRDGPAGELVLDVVAPESGVVYISEAYYPERQVWVDGERGELLRANVAFSAVKVEAGSHRIRIRYVPRSWYWGLAITFLTLASSAGSVAWRRRRYQFGARGRSTAGRFEVFEFVGSALGIVNESIDLSPPFPRLRMKRAEILKGTLIALSCGIVAYIGGFVFLTAVESIDETPHRINVRWIAGITADQRLETEWQLELESGEIINDNDDDRTWTYEIHDSTPEFLSAIVVHKLVEDTHGFDREAFTLPSARAGQRAFPFGVLMVVATAALLTVRRIGKNYK